MIVSDSQVELPQEIELPESPDLYKSARNNFVTKVYLILTGQLLLTSLFIGVVMNVPAISQFQNEYFGLIILSIIISLACIIAFACKPSISTSHPLNLILLALFTLAQSYTVSSICNIYDPSSVLLAAGITAAATIGLTLYAIYSKEDFSSYWQGISAIGWSFFMCVLFLSMMNMMINIPLISSLIALGSAIIYSAYIVIDTQLMIMGTGKTRLSLDNYILGAIFLYLDIIGLFLKILRIIGKKG